MQTVLNIMQIGIHDNMFSHNPMQQVDGQFTYIGMI